jgi:hypothetical protein
MATSWDACSPQERRRHEAEEVSPTHALPLSEAADFIAWLTASPPEFVLIILPIEKSYLGKTAHAEGGPAHVQTPTS